MPRKKDSMEEKRKKLSRLENSVSELVKQAKDSSVPGEEGREFRDHLDVLKKSFYLDLRQIYLLRNWDKLL